jgi:N-acetylneuraminic acid mutarotase
MRRLISAACCKPLWRVRLIVCLAGFLTTGHCFADAVSSAQGSDASWAPTGSLNVARAGHTVTLLVGGKILVAGGNDGSRLLDSAELYDPATGTWTLTGALGRPRSGHTATLLANGQVLVVGGEEVDVQATTAELYDPATGKWTQTGSVQTTRWGHTATLLQSGKVLVAGGLVRQTGLHGTSPALLSAELYDPATGTWQPTGALVRPRGLHAATRLQDGRVLIVAGQPNDDIIDGFYTSDAELYDSRTGLWSSTGNTGVPRGAGATATLLTDGKVLVTGGDIYDGAFCSLFDPAAGWGITGSMNVARFGNTATLLRGGEVLAFGGTDDNSAELYDPATGGWRVASSMSRGREAYAAAPTQDGKVLVAGGAVPPLTFDNTYLASAELYVADASPPVDNSLIDGSFTGTWFNSAQSGMGIMVEVLPGPPTQMLASWLTFSPQGGPSWIVGLGPIADGHATLEATQTVGSGARFAPSFDPTNARSQTWGELTFTFSDCDHGHVDWSSTIPGYGSGGMDLTRLTHPAGLTCTGGAIAQPDSAPRLE